MAGFVVDLGPLSTCAILWLLQAAEFDDSADVHRHPTPQFPVLEAGCG